MIYVGTDIVKVSRISQIISDHRERFLSRIFTHHEQSICNAKASPHIHYSGRFAAKEAVYKALSKSGVAGLGWREAEVINDRSGAPYIKLTGRCKTALESLTPEGYKPIVDISLSDEPPYALAYVVISAGTGIQDD